MAFANRASGRTEAVSIMTEFLERTGVTGSGAPERYLWTDAYAVCNLLALADSAEPGDATDHSALAATLVGQVHEVLGRHRADDPRRGWIGGLSEEEGRAHPTAGGLRIGKPLPERAPGEPLDEALEWNRDGQYFHYLTRWAHALQMMALHTGESRYGGWARELMDAACDGFVFTAGTSPRMVWKMSIELDRVQVPSMGHHDPLDGHIRCLELAAGAVADGDRQGEEAMRARAALLARMIRRDALATVDPLGLGGLLTDAALVAQLVAWCGVADEGLPAALLEAAAAGLGYHSRPEEHDPDRRLAFRELGLAIGLRGLPLVRDAVTRCSGAFRDAAAMEVRLDSLDGFAEAGAEIVAFWLEPGHRQTALWREHRNINEVMLATALVPAGALRLPDAIRSEIE